MADIDVVINIGAHAGYSCCLALQMGKHVVAFEPIHRNLRHLLRNVKANGWGSRIEVFPIALSDKIGVIEMYGRDTGASLVRGWAGISDTYVTLVPTTTANIALAQRFVGKKCLIVGCGG